MVARVLHGLVHGLDKAGTEWNVTVLEEDLIAPLSQNVVNLARNDGYRAPAAQEEVVLLTLPAGHHAVPSCNSSDRHAGTTERSSWSGASAPREPQMKSRDANRDVDPDLRAH